MKNKNFAILIFGCMVLGCVMAALVNHRIQIHDAGDPIAGAIIKMQKPVGIRRIDVLSGDEFDIVLEDGRRIHAVLDIKSTPDARSRVVDFISHCTNPRVVLKNRKDDVWIVHIYVTTNDVGGQPIEINLSKWLQEKQLAYN